MTHVVTDNLEDCHKDVAQNTLQFLMGMKLELLVLYNNHQIYILIYNHYFKCACTCYAEIKTSENIFNFALIYVYVNRIEVCYGKTSKSIKCLLHELYI